MSCQEWQERIAEQTGGEFAPDVAEHLGSCAACVALAEELESDRLALAAAPPEADYAAIRRQIRASIVRERRVRRYVPAVIAAAAVLAAAIVMRPHANPPAQPAPPAVAANIAAPPVPIEPVRPKPAVKRRHRSVALPADLVAVRWLASLNDPPKPGSDSPVEARIATSNPNVSIILLQAKESSNE